MSDYEAYRLGWVAGVCDAANVEPPDINMDQWMETDDADNPQSSFARGKEAGSQAYLSAMADKQILDAKNPSMSELAGVLYGRVTRAIAGQPGQAAITALIHAIVQAGKSTGADRKALIENIRKLWQT